MPHQKKIQYTSNRGINCNDDFVAIASTLNNSHCALLIQYDNQLHLFHFREKSIFLEFFENRSNINEEYYYKPTDVVDIDDIPQFIAQCKHVQKKANPKFGYFYMGDYYDTLGNHHSDSTPLRGEYMTCVGFCIAVINGHIEAEAYLDYETWETETLTAPTPESYLTRFSKRNNLDIEGIKRSLRRITPKEGTASCFFDENNLPISKSDVDSILKLYESEFP